MNFTLLAGETLAWLNEQEVCSYVCNDKTEPILILIDRKKKLL